MPNVISEEHLTAWQLFVGCCHLLFSSIQKKATRFINYYYYYILFCSTYIYIYIYIYIYMYRCRFLPKFVLHFKRVMIM